MPNETQTECCDETCPTYRCRATPLRATGVYQFKGSSGPVITMICKKRLRFTTQRNEKATRVQRAFTAARRGFGLFGLNAPAKPARAVKGENNG